MQLGDLIEEAPSGEEGAGAAPAHAASQPSSLALQARVQGWDVGRGMGNGQGNACEGLRHDTETKRAHLLRVAAQPLRIVDSKLNVARAPGLGIYYSELLSGVPVSLAC